jgi:hypothetical protein
MLNWPAGAVASRRVADRSKPRPSVDRLQKREWFPRLGTYRDDQAAPNRCGSGRQPEFGGEHLSHRFLCDGPRPTDRGETLHRMWQSASFWEEKKLRVNGEWTVVVCGQILEGAARSEETLCFKSSGQKVRTNLIRCPNVRHTAPNLQPGSSAKCWFSEVRTPFFWQSRRHVPHES